MKRLGVSTEWQTEEINNNSDSDIHFIFKSNPSEWLLEDNEDILKSDDLSASIFWKWLLSFYLTHNTPEEPEAGWVLGTCYNPGFMQVIVN